MKLYCKTCERIVGCIDNGITWCDECDKEYCGDEIKDIDFCHFCLLGEDDEDLEEL